MTIQQLEHPRQSGFGAEISGRERSGRRLAARQQVRFVVDVEADTNRDTRASRQDRGVSFRPTRAGATAARESVSGFWFLVRTGEPTRNQKQETRN
jgi:hypothetical protein